MRVLIHTAVPDARRADAATIEHLSGDPREYIVECTASQGGQSAAWDEAHDYNGKWWAASQSMPPNIAQDMLTSGYTLGTESWFVAYWEGTETIVPNGTNVDPPPANSSFDAFLSAAGLSKVVTSGPV